jgi:glycosyltransferase involved in cell wall biosynthesis
LDKSSPKIVNLVVPAYNEEDTIATLIETAFAELTDTRYRFTMIVVDDGSTDATAAEVRRCARRYPVTLVRLTRNFGKEAALLAGLDHADGDAVVLMDADLQHPVRLVKDFLERWEQGFQSVYAVRRDRSDETALKRWSTRAFYKAINYGTKVPIVPNALDFRLLDRVVVDALTSVRERVRFTKGLFAWVGYRSIGVPFVPEQRKRGSSRFNLRALSGLASDGLTSFSDFPLRLSAIVGFLVACASVAYGVWIWFRTLVFGVDVPGWATLTVAITFLSGLQMMFLGVIGEYVRNIYLESKHRPNYLVAESTPSPTSAGAAKPPRGPLRSEAAAAPPSRERPAA